MENDRFAKDCGVATNRFDDALAIQQGACNPSGVARALVRAINACYAENADTPDVRNDPAVRLICHQLAFLLAVSEIDYKLDVYGQLEQECKDKSAAIKAAKAGGSCTS